MPTKEQIINNLREYSASDIVHAIRCGEVTLYELSKSGKLTPLLRKRIEEQLANSSDMKDLEEENAHIPVAETPSIVTTPQVSAIEKKQELQVPATPINPIPLAMSPSAACVNGNSNERIRDNKGMFKRPFSFKGRIRRAEYGLSYIIYFLWYVVFIAITAVNDINPAMALLAILSMVAAFWFMWTQGAKRCHDRGNSGWYQIIPFYFLVMLFGGSESGINDYGTNPKE